MMRDFTSGDPIDATIDNHSIDYRLYGDHGGVIATGSKIF